METGELRALHLCSNDVVQVYHHETATFPAVNFEAQDYVNVGKLLTKDLSLLREYQTKLAKTFKALICQFLMYNRAGLVVLCTVSMAATMNHLCAMRWNSIIVDESGLLSQTDLDCVASIQHDSFVSVGDTLQKPLRLERDFNPFSAQIKLSHMGFIVASTSWETTSLEIQY